MLCYRTLLPSQVHGTLYAKIPGLISWEHKQNLSIISLKQDSFYLTLTKWVKHCEWLRFSSDLISLSLDSIYQFYCYFCWNHINIFQEFIRKCQARFSANVKSAPIFLLDLTKDCFNDAEKDRNTQTTLPGSEHRYEHDAIWNVQHSLAPHERKVPSNSMDKPFILSKAVFFLPTVLLGLPRASILPHSIMQATISVQPSLEEVWC